MVFGLFLIINSIYLISNDLIPHIIHFAWFSENPKPELVKNCISSWKKHSPGWLIIQWTLEMIYPFENDFIKEAYKLKKYAFVADYLRVKYKLIFSLYNYGGVYIDSDVELKAPLNPFLNHSFFVSQSRDKWLHVAPDCFGSVKGHPLLKEMLKHYKTKHFIKNDGNLDETWVGIIFTRKIKKLYNITLDIKIQNSISLPDNGSIYPTFYFEQKMKGKLNIANHYCTGSWYGNKYNDEKILANCYYDCRNNLKAKEKLKFNRKKLKDKDFILNIELLLLNLFVLIVDIILKLFYFLVKKKSLINN